MRILKKIKTVSSIYRKQLNSWVNKHLVGLFVFNLIILFLVLLSNAGYFQPFFYLSINLITFISLILSIFLLGSSSRSMFVISILFLFFAGFLRFFQINIWAERSGIYAFQSFLLGLFLFLYK